MKHKKLAIINKIVFWVGMSCLTLSHFVTPVNMALVVALVGVVLLGAWLVGSHYELKIMKRELNASSEAMRESMRIEIELPKEEPKRYNHECVIDMSKDHKDK